MDDRDGIGDGDRRPRVWIGPPPEPPVFPWEVGSKDDVGSEGPAPAPRKVRRVVKRR